MIGQWILLHHQRSIVIKFRVMEDAYDGHAVGITTYAMAALGF